MKVIPKHSDVVRAAWLKGILRYKLYDYQQPLYDLIANSTSLKFVLNCSRRFGKTTILCLYAMEFAIRNPGSYIRFAAPTGKALKKIILPIFKMLLKDCPEDLHPTWNGMDCFYHFPNGSEIHLAGTDNGNAENLRGQVSHLNVIDEAADINELDYVYRSILLPQTLTTNGRTILASTPPKTPAHDFYDICLEAQVSKEYAEYTIWDNKTLSKEMIDKYAKESGGYESTHFKREYECKFVVDEDSVIIREWKDEYVRATEKSEFYPYYHKYVGMDLGVKDYTACIFGYYDFKRATLVIEDEFKMNGPSMTTNILKDTILSKEKELWGKQKPYRRISDNNNLLLVQDLTTIHGINFIPTSKDNLDAMINEVRLLVASGRLEVHPRCEQLIGCLKYGVWSTSKTKREFARSNVYGHFDMLAALVYLIRNLDQNTNPVPTNYNKSGHTHWIDNKQTHSKSIESLKRIFAHNRKN